MNTRAQPKHPQKGIKSVDIAARLLEALAMNGGPKALKVLAEDAAVPPAKAHRFLVSLIRCGLAKQDPSTAQYDLGDMTLRIGLAALERLDFVQAATEAAVALNQRIDRTTFVVIWGQHGPVIIRMFESSGRPIVWNGKVGTVLPLLTTASGRVFLSFLPRAVTRPLVSRELRQHVVTSLGQPIRSRQDLLKLADQVRKRGYGRTESDNVPGLSAISAPIISFQNDMVAAVTAIDRTGQLPESGPGSPVSILLEVAGTASRRLGYTSGPRGRVMVAPVDTMPRR